MFSTIRKAIISSVGKLSESDFEVIANHFELVILNSKTKLPFKNLYKTPKTLGVDRIALVCASVKSLSRQ